MTELQKEYCEEKGLIYIKPENTEISDYVNWLETKIQALRIHDVVGRSEQLPCDCGVMLKETTIQVFCPKCYKTWKMK